MVMDHQGVESTQDRDTAKVIVAIGIATIVVAITSLIGSAASAATAARGWWTTGSASFEWLKAFPTAIVTLALGLLAAWIANGQKNIAAAQKEIAAAQRDVAAARLNLDLFEKRLPVYDSLDSFLKAAPKTAVLSEGGYAPMWGMIDSMTEARTLARLLFDPSVEGLFETAVTKALILKKKINDYSEHDGDSPERRELGKEAIALAGWMHTTQQDLPSLFRRYLDFSAWGSR
jgi:hypothetical protein